MIKQPAWGVEQKTRSLGLVSETWQAANGVRRPRHTLVDRPGRLHETSFLRWTWCLPFTEDCCIDRLGPDSAGHLCTLLEYCLSRQVFLFTDVSTTLPKTTQKKSWWCYYFIKCKRNQRQQDNKMKVSNLVFKSVLKKLVHQNKKKTSILWPRFKLYNNSNLWLSVCVGKTVTVRVSISAQTC